VDSCAQAMLLMTRLWCLGTLQNGAARGTSVIATHAKSMCVQVHMDDPAKRTELSRGKHKQFEALGSLSEPPTSCGLTHYQELVEGPKKGDDDKRLCGRMLRGLRPQDVIVSIGSNNEFGFEEQMLACTRSHIATFDCTVANATNKPRTSRVSFHPYCIGTADMNRFLSWKSTSELALGAARLHSDSSPMDQARPPRIAVLKADIEGWEWVVLDHVVRTSSSPSSLPQQIAVEIHLRTHAWRNVTGFVKGDLTSPAFKLRQLRQRLGVAGYALVDRNDNPWCSHCSELLFVRS